MTLTFKTTAKDLNKPNSLSTKLTWSKTSFDMLSWSTWFNPTTEGGGLAEMVISSKSMVLYI